jgi:hypothetical protein
MRTMTNLARGFILLLCSPMVVDADAQTAILSAAESAGFRSDESVRRGGSSCHGLQTYLPCEWE